MSRCKAIPRAGRFAKHVERQQFDHRDGLDGEHLHWLDVEQLQLDWHIQYLLFVQLVDGDRIALWDVSVRPRPREQ